MPPVDCDGGGGFVPPMRLDELEEVAIGEVVAVNDEERSFAELGEDFSDGSGGAEELRLVGIGYFHAELVTVPEMAPDHIRKVMEVDENLPEALKSKATDRVLNDRHAIDRQHDLWNIVGQPTETFPFTCRKKHGFHGLMVLGRIGPGHLSRLAIWLERANLPCP